MVKNTPNAGDAIKKLEEKDAEPNNESARTNEILAGRAAASDEDPVAVSLRLNDPSLSRSAHTSEKTGFNEDLDRSDDAEVAQSKAVSKNK
jgi:hypothetical protein